MARGERRYTWGWSAPARVVLAGLGLSMALMLLRAAPRAGQAPAVDPVLVVDPNSAPRAVLLALPRLGPVLADRVVAERSRKPFHSLDDVDARVRGIGPVTAAALRAHLQFVPASGPARNVP